jgi:peptidoglycan hydrolase-like protein with peptidoglycan-binding domain
MDGVFKSFGVKGVKVVVEEIPDNTSKVKVGAKDMFMSATSGMTRSSQAIRLIPWDRGKVFEGREEIVKAANYAVQGSISQFDETMLRKQRDGAVCIGPLCVGAADSDSFSGLSLDLNMIETEGLTLMPGVTSKNYVLIRRKGRGYDGDLTLKKFGVQYNFVFNSSDGQGQALRTLVELSVIELYGRLLKIPYWTCLGLTDSDPGVAAEIEDWWETLRGDLPSLAAYLQAQMRAKGLFDGEVDGVIDERLLRAVMAYKAALGLPEDTNFDGDVFRRYLIADHSRIQPLAVQKLAAINAKRGPTGPVATSPEANRPPVASDRAASVSILSSRGAYKRGERIDLEISADRDVFLYCYLIDSARKVVQFFPNGVQPSASLRGGAKLQIPGRFPFVLKASSSGATETVACLAALRDPGRTEMSFDSAVRDAVSLRDAFASRVGEPVALGVFDVKVQ